MGRIEEIRSRVDADQEIAGQTYYDAISDIKYLLSQLEADREALQSQFDIIRGDKRLHQPCEGTLNVVRDITKQRLEEMER